MIAFVGFRSEPATTKGSGPKPVPTALERVSNPGERKSTMWDSHCPLRGHVRGQENTQTVYLPKWSPNPKRTPDARGTKCAGCG